MALQFLLDACSGNLCTRQWLGSHGTAVPSLHSPVNLVPRPFLTEYLTYAS